MTKQIDANWAAGDDAGGFPSGLSLAADTGYYLFAIGKADGTVDFGFDTSATAANLLSDATGYTYYKAIWWVITNSSSNIRGFVQINGDTCEYSAGITDVNDTTGTSGVNETGTISAPPSSEVKVHGYVNNSSAAGISLYINNLLCLYNYDFIGGKIEARVDSNSQLAYKFTVSSGGLTSEEIVTQGWRKKW